MANQLPTIVLIGAGKLGYQLGKALLLNKLPLTQVFSREITKAKNITQLSNYSTPINNLQSITPSADIYIIAVKDDAIEEVATQLTQIIPPTSFVVHTSGATTMQPIAKYFSRVGVFYPFQSFSLEKEADFTQIPLCLTTQHSADLTILQQIGNQLQSPIYTMSDQQRSVLHVAAVFANNFTNHIYTIAEDILQTEQLPFDLLKPLIQETTTKALQFPPNKMQTGPAIRGDEKTISRHKDLLRRKQPHEITLLYELLTENIKSKYSS